MINWIAFFMISKKIFFIILLRKAFMRSISIISWFFYIYKLTR